MKKSVSSSDVTPRKTRDSHITPRTVKGKISKDKISKDKISDETPQKGGGDVSTPFEKGGGKPTGSIQVIVRLRFQHCQLCRRRLTIGR